MFDIFSFVVVLINIAFAVVSVFVVVLIRSRVVVQMTKLHVSLGETMFFLALPQSKTREYLHGGKLCIPFTSFFSV